MKALLTLLILVFFIGLKLTACDCVITTTKKKIKPTGFILAGRFIEGEKMSELSGYDQRFPIYYYTGKFIITDVLNGKNIKKGDTLSVTSDFTNCSFMYQNNFTYLLFTNMETRKLKTSNCSDSGELDKKEMQTRYKEVKKLLRKRFLFFRYQL